MTGAALDLREKEQIPVKWESVNDANRRPGTEMPDLHTAFGVVGSNDRDDN